MSKDAKHTSGFPPEFCCFPAINVNNNDIG